MPHPPCRSVRVSTVAGGGGTYRSSVLPQSQQPAVAASSSAAVPLGSKPLIPLLPLHRVSEASVAAAASSASPLADASEVLPVGQPGFVDGIGSDARFSSPTQLVLQQQAAGAASAAAALCVLLTDRDNHAIRRIDLHMAAVSTVACRATHLPTTAAGASAAAAASSASAIATPAASTGSDPHPLLLPLHSPTGLLLDPQSSGSWLLVSDSANHMIRKIWLPLGPTAAAAAGAGTGGARHARWSGGSEGVLGWENEGDDEFIEAEDARTDVAPHAAASSTPLTARRRTAAAGDLTTPTSRPTTASGRRAAGVAPPHSLLAAAPSVSTVSTAKFAHPRGLCWDSSSSLWICDRGNGKLKRIDATGRVFHVVPGATHTAAALADSLGVSTSAGVPAPVGLLSRSLRPECVLQDARGNVVFTDSASHCIWQLSPAGVLSVLAGVPRAEGGFRDGPGAEALFNAPTGLALEQATNTIFVADSANHAIRIITQGGVVTTIAGGGRGQGRDTARAQEEADSYSASYSASSSSASSSMPHPPTQRPTSAIPAASPRSYSGREPPAASTSASAFAASDSQEGFVDGPGSHARFFRPEGLALDQAQGRLFVADTGNHAIRCIHIEQQQQHSEDRVSGTSPPLRSFGSLVPAAPFPTSRIAQQANASFIDTSSSVPALITARRGGGDDSDRASPPSATVSSPALQTGGMNRYASMPTLGNTASARPATAALRPGSGSRIVSAASASASSVPVTSPPDVSPAPPSLPSDPRQWSRLDVSFWLLGLNASFDAYLPSFWSARIDGPRLLAECATESVLSQRLGVSSKMHRNTLVREVLSLRNPGDSAAGGNEGESDDEGTEAAAAGSHSGAEGVHSPGSSGHSSRAASAGSSRPLSARPSTASGWRPSSATPRAAAAADALLTSMQRRSEQPQPPAEPRQRGASAASASAAAAASASRA